MGTIPLFFIVVIFQKDTAVFSLKEVTRKESEKSVEAYLNICCSLINKKCISA
jgi:hypothetical protein